LAAVGAGGGAQAAPFGRAHAARAQSVTDTAHLRYVGEVGEGELLEEGYASGNLPARVRVRFRVGATVTAGFTIYAHGGTISGRGFARLHSNGTWASFGGTMSAAHGTGRFAHVHGHGGFYGVINRYTYATVVQTTGTLYY
jgi:hypothetical protein